MATKKLLIATMLPVTGNHLERSRRERRGCRGPTHVLPPPNFLPHPRRQRVEMAPATPSRPGGSRGGEDAVETGARRQPSNGLNGGVGSARRRRDSVVWEI